MSGSASDRVVEVTASAGRWRALTYSIDETIVGKNTCTCRPRRSASAGPPPRYGTCTMSTPAIILNSSPQVRAVSDTSRRHVDLARIGFGIGDELGNSFCRHQRMDH